VAPRHKIFILDLIYFLIYTFHLFVFASVCFEVVGEKCDWFACWLVYAISVGVRFHRLWESINYKELQTLYRAVHGE